jgi:F-type H+-transporting ATPase subunit epsilon
VLFELGIVTPEGRVYQGRVESVVLPGSEGDFGVLGGHERFLAPLRIGEIEIRDERGRRFAAISGGFADVSGEQVVVLAETCELAERIDVARAERARERAERELGRLLESGAEEQRFRLEQAALERALVRIQAAARGR